MTQYFKRGTAWDARNFPGKLTRLRLNAFAARWRWKRVTLMPGCIWADRSFTWAVWTRRSTSFSPSPKRQIGTYVEKHWAKSRQLFREAHERERGGNEIPRGLGEIGAAV